MLEIIAQQKELFTRWRKDIHANPELGFEEHRTSSFVAHKLTRWGFDEVHRNIANTGVVGVLRGNRESDKAIALRADMDALEMDELNTFEHRSLKNGRMHACGHDGHTAILLATAWYLSRHRDFSGTVYFIFQPAEEGLAGAKAMVDDGLFSRFPCQRIYGMHNMPGIPQGHLWVKSGPILASSDRFTVDITGKGGHAGMPHMTIDPVIVMADLIGALQTISSRSIKAIEPIVLSITDVHAGSGTHNVIPKQALLKGCIRAFSDETRNKAITRMSEITNGIAVAHGAEIKLTFKQRGYPATINHPTATEIAQKAALKVLGASKVMTDFSPLTGSEDFSFLSQCIPGCYLLIGNGVPGMKGGICVHNPTYDFNDDIIPVGASLFVEVVRSELG